MRSHTVVIGLLVVLGHLTHCTTQNPPPLPSIDVTTDDRYRLPRPSSRPATSSSSRPTWPRPPSTAARPSISTSPSRSPRSCSTRSSSTSTRPGSRPSTGDRVDATVSYEPETERVRLGLARHGRPGPGRAAHAVPRDRSTTSSPASTAARSPTRPAPSTSSRHPVRGDVRPQGVPVLGRARVQGDLRRHARRPRRPAGAVERRRGRADADRRRAGAGPLRRDDEDVDVPGRVRRRPPRRHRPGRRRRHPAAGGDAAGQAAPGRARHRRRRRDPPLLHRLLRDPLPGRQGRPHRHPRLRVRRHGEPGRHHVPRDRPAARPRAGPPSPSSSGSPTSSTTSWPTCGSATW